MTDNRYDRVLRKRTRGSLDMKSLWRVSTGANNVFMQRQARKNKNYNIVLLVDRSGSMNTVAQRYRTSMEALAVREYYLNNPVDMSQALQRFGYKSSMGLASELAAFLTLHFQEIGVQLAIYGFSSAPVLVKDFEQRLTPKEVYGKLNHSFGGTNLAPALENAYGLLKHRQNNFIIVITDGETAYIPECRRLIRANERTAKVFGVGIGMNIKNLITDSVEIDTAEKLKPEILKYLNRNIRRGL